jgi:hypothetical protein
MRRVEWLDNLLPAVCFSALVQSVSACPKHAPCLHVTDAGLLPPDIGG